MWLIGLDVHQRTSTICILDGNGRVVKIMTIRGSRLAVIAKLRSLNHPFKICYEASCGYGFLYDELRQIAEEVKVAHPGQLHLIFRSKRKNDRVDAKKLAMLLLMDLVPEVYVPSIQVRDWRSLIEFRRRTVGERIRLKNRIRGLFRGHGVDLPAGARLWTKKGRDLLATAELPTSSATVQRDMLLDDLTRVEEKIKRLEKELDAIADRHPGVCLLRTVPGVGPRTAEAVMAYVDDPRRFRKSKQFGCYLGFTPQQDQSADQNRLGHITRQGPATVRQLLVEATWQGIRRSPRLRNCFERIQGDDPKKRKKIALVATAHYLARIMIAMLKSGEEWREISEEKQAA